MTAAALIRRTLDAARVELSYTLRSLTRAPGLSVAVVVTFGLGVGANAAVFTALDRVFLRPPAGVVRGGELRRLYPHNYYAAQFGRNRGDRITPFANGRDLVELAAAVRPLANLEGDYLYRRGRLLPEQRRIIVTYVSPGYFDMLGVRPARGRFFAPEENRFGAPLRLVVVSDAFWRTRLGSDPDALGKTLRIVDDASEGGYTIVGVAPPQFEGLELEAPDMWMPLSMFGPDITSLKLVARPHPGVSDRALAAALTQAYRRIHTGDPVVTDSSSIIVGSALAARAPAGAGATVPLIPGMSDRSRDLLLRLGGLGLIVLVIAVANVASLLLMRAMRRRREMAVRLALGVSRRRLIGQLLIESVVLALAASGVALLATQLAGGALRSQLSSFRWAASVVDHRVMAFALGVGIVGGIVAGTMPGVLLLRIDVSRALRAGGVSATRTSSAMPTVLLVIQAASCTALLACGGAFLESFQRAGSYDRGFDPHHLLQISIPAYGSAAEGEASDIERQLRSMPGIDAVGRSISPLNARTYLTKVGPSYRDTIGTGPRGPWAEYVDRQFMAAVGLRLIAGRLLTAEDEVEPTTVLTESLAAELFPDGRAIGACVHIREPDSPCRTVVGIVRDVEWDVAETPMLRLYIPLIQAFAKTNPALIPITLYVRTHHAASVNDVRNIHAVVDRIASDRQVTVQPVDTLLEPLSRPWRLAATLSLLLGLLGLAAATTGIYGLVAFDVTERSREFGIRAALGATPASILRLVLGSGLRVAAMGVAAGVVAAMLMGIVINSLLFESAPWDPVVLLITTGTLGLAAVVASVMPAWRAVRLDPVRVLASE